MSICKKVIFSSRAYNAVISDTYSRISTETGGIFLGHVEQGVWYIIETLDPGPNSIFRPSYFEYDTKYVNNLAKALEAQYKKPLSLLGLWHRHPGSFDQFSKTDDETNRAYANLNPMGAISGLVNIDPLFRFTMYHVSLPLKYREVDIEIGDNKVLPHFLEYKHIKDKDRGSVAVDNIDVAKGGLGLKNQFEDGSSDTSFLVKIGERLINRFQSLLKNSKQKKSKKEESGYGDEQSVERARVATRKNDLLFEKMLDIIAFEEVQFEIENISTFTRELDDNSCSIEYTVELNREGHPRKKRSFRLFFENNNPFVQINERVYEYRPEIFIDYIYSEFHNSPFDEKKVNL